MIFASPEWFLLLPILAFLGWYWRSLKLWEPLRALCLILLVTALARPQIRLLEEGMDLWVLVDRSMSARGDLEPALPEWEKLLAQGRGKEDRLKFVDFADVSFQRGQGDGDVFAGTGQYTRIPLAVDYALAHADPKRVARMLILTDGYSTEPLTGLAERLIHQQIPMDYRLVTAPKQVDYRVRRLKMRSRVQVAEPFLIEIEVTGQPDGEVPLEVYRGQTMISNTKVKLEDGRAVVRFTDRLGEAGGHQYVARVAEPTDARPGNNRAGAWVEVVAGPRILLLTNYPDDPVAKTLQAQGFAVDVVTETGKVDIGRLSGARALVLNNVPAHRLPPEFIQALPFYVNVQGGGLLMVGGKNSFGSGGYFGSPVDSLLPVSTELRQEHRKLATAMAVIIDRSGSMAATVAKGVTKIELAGEGAARAADLLGDQDAITVYAVDSSPHQMVPLTQLEGHRGEIAQRIRRIESMGGGIFVYTGLKAGWEELQKAEVGQRHLILFSDAADSEEPGDYIKLVEEMTKAGVTISVIGVGTDKDVDAAFLQDIAKRGNGRIFFSDDASDVPALFAQETVAVARSTFIEEQTPMSASAGWLEIAAKAPDWPPAVDGYNLCYPRPGAAVALVSTDEYNSPLISLWPRGAGRAAAVTFPLGGDFSQRIRGWVGYGDMVQTLGRWLMGEDVPPGIAIQAEADGEQLLVHLLYTKDWEERLAQAPPKLLVATSASSEPKALAWERLRPGEYIASMPLSGADWVQGAVQAGKYSIPFGPVAAPLDIEWSAAPTRVDELRQASRTSQGEERVDLTRAWEAPERKEFQDIRHWLLIAMAPLFILDVFFARMGIKMAGIPWLWGLGAMRVKRSREKRAATVKPTPAARPVATGKGSATVTAAEKEHQATLATPEKPPEAAPKAAAPEPKPEAPPPQARQSRFSRAKVKDRPPN